MNSWESVTQVVRSFNSKGRPGAALAAYAMYVLRPLLYVLLAGLIGALPAKHAADWLAARSAEADGADAGHDKR